jgi:hypothetical protein
MKKSAPAKKPASSSRPPLKWQTGDYARDARFEFHLPYPFLLLCRLMDTTPEQILVDFMDNLACASWKREGRDRAKKHLVDYFIEHGYGQQLFSETDRREMFRELDAIGLLFPRSGDMKMIDAYVHWRNRQQHYWFAHWLNKQQKPSPDRIHIL